MKAREGLAGVSGEVLTLEEVSAYLRVPAEKLASEIASGRLTSLRISDEIRILRTDLLSYLDLARSSAEVTPKSKRDESPDSETRVVQGAFDRAKPFEHMWPNGRKEQYTEAFVGTAQVDGSTRSMLIGFTERQSAGRDRKRAVVFVDKRPLVEFVGADDFEKSEKMVSLVKRKNGRRLRPGESIPNEYRHLRIEPYRKYVTGAYASSNQALVCSKSNFNVMAEHALIRLRQIESRA